MKKKQIIGLVIAAVLFIAVGVSSVLTNTFSQKMLNDSVEHILTGDYRFNAPLSDYIAIVRVEGTIQEQTQTGIFDSPEGYQHLTTMEYIDDLMEDSNNKGILLYVDSPGGTVYESEELYLKLKRLQRGHRASSLDLGASTMQRPEDTWYQWQATRSMQIPIPLPAPSA